MIFDYDQTPGIQGLSLRFEAGSLTTLVGPSGSGKTTIVDLTIGLLQPQQGKSCWMECRCRKSTSSSGAA